MMSNIHDDEGLFRRLKNIPQYWKNDENRPTSALFKDNLGVSVDRCNFRCKDEVIEDEERLHKIHGNEADLKSIVSVKKGICNDLLVKYDPVEGNDYHSLILRDEDNIVLTKSQAKRLAEQCKIEKTYNV